MAKQIADKIMDLLEKEREQVLDGTLDGLSESSAEKARLFALLEQHGDTDPRRLQKLATMVERNQSLLKAAMRGIADAQTRLAAIRSAGSGLCTYSSEGQKAALNSRTSAVEHRV